MCGLRIDRAHLIVEEELGPVSGWVVIGDGDIIVREVL